MQNNYRVLFVDSKTSQCTCKGIVSNFYTYIYAFSRRFYPKRLGHSGYTCFFYHYVCSLGIEPTLLHCQHNALPLSHRNTFTIADFYLPKSRWHCSPRFWNLYLFSAMWKSNLMTKVIAHLSSTRPILGFIYAINTITAHLAQTLTWKMGWESLEIRFYFFPIPCYFFCLMKHPYLKTRL